MKIGFIGVGNMGGAILNGFVNKNPQEANNVYAFDVNEEQLQKQCEKAGIRVASSIKELVSQSHMVLIGIKPNQYENVLPQIMEGYEDHKVLISMAAGVSIPYIETFAGHSAKVIRIMPNTPAMVCEGMIAVCKNANVSEKDMEAALFLLDSVGKTCQVAEELIHCVIGVSGSSPAYTYMYIEALAKAAEKNGMEEKQAILFAAQSVLGAAKMVLETGISPQTLRDNVCSPGGTTIEAVQTLQANGFADKIAEGFQAAVEKSKQMSK